MSIKRILTILICFCFSFCTNTAIAQDDDYNDSTEYTKDENIAYIDTSILFTPYLALDSLESFRQSKDFAYMTYLDSLLKKTKGIKSDTISAGKNDTGTIQRSGKHDADTIVKENPPVLDNNVVKILLWILAGGFLLFVLYKLFFANGIFKKERKLKPAANIEEEDEEIFLSDFDRKIQAAWKTNNFKLVVRYLYLQTLNKLSEAGHIHYASEKTNYQYVREVYSKSYRNEFAALTLNYEYIWYGNFEINENICRRLETEFNDFNKKV